MKKKSHFSLIGMILCLAIIFAAAFIANREQNGKEHYSMERRIRVVAETFEVPAEVMFDLVTETPYLENVPNLEALRNKYPSGLEHF